jgi:dTMP kinase
MDGYKGYLIALEGGEGVGKTTQVARLIKRLKSLGKEVIAVREPGGTDIGEQIREVVLSNENTGIKKMTEIFLFQAARAQVYREVIIPALMVGTTVIIDRSRDSSTVYQGLVRGYDGKIIEMLNDLTTKNIYPDLTLLLDASVETGTARNRAAGSVNRLDLKSGDFHQRVRKGYLQLAKENKGHRWITIDAERSLDEVEKAVWTEVEKKLAQ